MNGNNFSPLQVWQLINNSKGFSFLFWAHFSPIIWLYCSIYYLSDFCTWGPNPEWVINLIWFRVQSENKTGCQTPRMKSRVYAPLASISFLSMLPKNSFQSKTAQSKCMLSYQCKACALNRPRAYQRSQAHFIYEQFYARSKWQVIPKRNAMRLLYIRCPWQNNRTAAAKQNPIKRLNNTDSCRPSIVIWRIICPIISLI